MNKTLLLVKLQLIYTFGINELKHGHNGKKVRQTRTMYIVYAVLGLGLALFWFALCNSLSSAGNSSLILLLSCIGASGLILVLNIFMSGFSVFNPRGFAREITLPVRSLHIVLSRIIPLYLVNILFAMIFFIPACLVLASASGWLYGLLGILFAPFIPMTVSLAIGIIVSAASARLPQKNIISTILSVTLVIVLLVVLFVNTRNTSSTFMDDIAGAMASFANMIGAWYPPAAWFASGNIAFLGLFMAVSVGLFSLFTALSVWKYAPICSAMNTHYAKHQFKMTALSAASQSKALFRYEMKRYVSSSAYMSNTIVGYVLCIVFAIGVCVLGPETINGFFKGDNLIETLSAFLLSLFIALSPLTYASFSIEGKNFWIKQSLPLTMKQVLKAKLMVHLLIGGTAVLIAGIILQFPLHISGLERIMIILIPLAFVVYSGVLGLYMNLRNPNFTWETENQAVKQGRANFYTILFGIISAFVVQILIKTQLGLVVGGAVAVIALILLSVVLYRKCLKFELSDLDS